MKHVTDDNVRLVSYNIRKAMGTDRRRDPHRIINVLRDAHPDIAILQEADLRLGQRRAALVHTLFEETHLRPVPLATNDVSLGWHGNAILVRPEWKILEVQRIALPGLEPRGAVSTLIETPQGALRIMGLHLGLLRKSRQGQQHSLLDWLDKQPDAPTVMAGDLNEWSARRGLAPLMQRFNLQSPGHSFHARWRLAPLDRIGVTPELSLQDLAMIDTPLTRAASDHLPIRAHVHWNTSAA